MMYKIQNYIKEMGGNAFEDTQPLTPQQYESITAEITQIISPICTKLQPYIPLPEKETHGDIDFLLILQPGKTIEDIQQLLQIEAEHFKKNPNMTANSVFRKKQVDFNVAANDEEFLRCRFYKSYGGIGAFLGLFLPSKFVKLNQEGLVCCAYHEHLKLQFLVCNNIKQILIFYGLDPQRYEAGFKTRRELFNYLRGIRFLDENQFLSHTTKHQTKIMKAFQDFLRNQGTKPNQNYTIFEDACSSVLQYFKLSSEFDNAWKQKLQGQAKKKERQGKWNGMHIMKIFKVESKGVNSYKKKFESFFKNKGQYEEYIEQTPFDEILRLFSKVCQLEPV